MFDKRKETEKRRHKVVDPDSQYTITDYNRAEIAMWLGEIDTWHACIMCGYWVEK